MNFKDLSITASITVLACTRAKTFEGQEQNTKEGKPLYELAIKSTEKKKIADQEFESEIVSKLKSEIQLEKGEHKVILIQFNMSEQNSKKVESHYRVVGIAQVIKKAL